MDLSFLDNKTILITGGTGSFGQRCVEMLLRESSAPKVIIFSRDELKQSQMQARFAADDERIRFFLGDVRERERLDRAFYGVDYVIHAAALKQVPALEYNPFEAVKTNICGAQNVIDAAINQDVKKVIFISTDKAVNPINLYGATKLCAEKLMISANAYGAGRTIFSICRYGNIIGSRGSLVEIIHQQKERNFITITDPRMTRFWITLHQGVGFVLHALKMMNAGEIFVPKIPSMKIVDLVNYLAPGCEQKIIGARQGEKIHELLLSEYEARRAVEYNGYYIIYPDRLSLDRDEFNGGRRLAENFNYASNTNTRWVTENELQEILKELPSSYVQESRGENRSHD